MKNLFKVLFLNLFIIITVNAKIEVTWFGTTTFNISDGQTAIFFDPFVTRPGLLSVMTFRSEKSNIFHVKRWLNKIDKENIKAIFVSHSHYDHALDLANFQRETKAKVYGSNSSKNILLGAKIDASNFIYSKEGKTFKIGDFKVTILKGEHPSHFLGMTLWGGSIDRPLPEDSSASSYKQGEVYNYFIEHPLMNIFFHPSGKVALKKKDLKGKNAEVLIQGIAKRDSTESIIKDIIDPIKPKIVIPAHHDDFFLSLEEGYKPMSLVNPEEFFSTLKKEKKHLIMPRLKFGERYELKVK